MKAMLFCAGHGTRMGPLADLCPKPAMPLYGRPLISHALRWLWRQGAREVVVNLHHLPDQVRQAALAHGPRELSVVFSQEPDLLGTGGGLARAAPHFRNEPFFLAVNGDVFTRIDLRIPLRVHRHRRPLSTLVLSDAERNRALFGVGLDSDKRIVDFWGEPASPSVFRRCAFTGIHVLDPKLLDRLPPDGFACIKEQGYLPALREGARLWGAIVQGAWFDLGTPSRYLDAHLEMSPELEALSGLPMRAPQVASAEPLPEGLVVRPPVVIGAGLKLEGRAVVGPAAFLGSNVTLEAGAEVSQAVAWDGARLAGRVERAIVAPGIEPVSASS